MAYFHVKHNGTGVVKDFFVQDNKNSLTELNTQTVFYSVYLDLLLIEKLSNCPSMNPQAIKELKLTDISLKDKYLDEFKNIINNNNSIVKIDITPCHSVGLKADGTVVACGLNTNKQCDVDSINFYIYDIAVNDFNTVGLSLDRGEIKYCGWNGLKELTNSDIWKNIISIKLGKTHAVGLKQDETVIACGDKTKGQCDVQDWKDIIAIAVGDNHTIGLKKDGTVIACGDNSQGQCDVQNWTNVKSIFAKLNNTVALKQDGTVVACGDNAMGQCNTADWQNITDITIGYANIAGIKDDGTAVVSGDDLLNQCKVQDWTDIIKIGLGNFFTVGLKKDGSVVAVGWNKYGQCNTADWKDIVDIAVSYSHVLGLSKDGKVFAIGWNEHGQCDVQNWNN